MVCSHHPLANGSDSSVRAVCRHCVNFVSPEPPDAATIRRVNALDFRSPAPPPKVCGLCGKHYADWETEDRAWALLPPEHQPLELCEDDFARLLREAGHDPAAFPITHETQATRQAFHDKAKTSPATQTQIAFDLRDRLQPAGEYLWCDVLQARGGLVFAVRLRNDSLFDPAVRTGTLWLAKWDGRLYHGISGRPLLRPVRRLASLKQKRARRR